MRIKLDIEKMKKCYSFMAKDDTRGIHGIHISQAGYAATNGYALMVCPGGPEVKESFIIRPPVKIKKIRELWYNFDDQDLEYHGSLTCKFNCPIIDKQYPNISKVLGKAKEIEKTLPQGWNNGIPINPKYLRLFKEEIFLSLSNPNLIEDAPLRDLQGRVKRDIHQPIFVIPINSSIKWVGMIAPSHCEFNFYEDVEKVFELVLSEFGNG